MFVKVLNRNYEFQALLDSGMTMNVMCLDIYKRIKEAGNIRDETTCNYTLKGISNVPVHVIKKIKIDLVMYGCNIGSTEFLVLQKDTDKYDLILGLNFLKEKKIILHPHLNAVEWQFPLGNSQTVFLENEGLVLKKIHRGEPLIAENDVMLGDSPTLIKVRWKNSKLQEEPHDQMFVEGTGGACEN